MRIAFFVNSIRDEAPRFTTTVLALAASDPRPRHLLPDARRLRAAARRPADGPGPHAARGRLQEGRDPAQGAAGRRDADRDHRRRRDRRPDAAQRSLARHRRASPWAAHVGERCSAGLPWRAACSSSTIPTASRSPRTSSTSRAFPEAVRPPTLISKSIEEIRAFIDEQAEGVIVKPLQGSGGKNVFKIDSAGDANLNQIFEAVSRGRLPDRPALHPGGDGGRRPPVPDERHAPRARRQVRGASPCPRQGRAALQHARAGQGGEDRGDRRHARHRRHGAAEAGRATGCSWSASISSATRSWRSTSSRRAASTASASSSAGTSRRPSSPRWRRSLPSGRPTERRSPTARSPRSDPASAPAMPGRLTVRRYLSTWFHQAFSMYIHCIYDDALPRWKGPDPDRCQLRVTARRWAERVMTCRATSEPTRCSRTSILPSPSDSWRRVTSSTKAGSTGSSKITWPFAASKPRPMQERMSDRIDAAAHACGAQATG